MVSISGSYLLVGTPWVVYAHVILDRRSYGRCRVFNQSYWVDDGRLATAGDPHRAAHSFSLSSLVWPTQTPRYASITPPDCRLTSLCSQELLCSIMSRRGRIYIGHPVRPSVRPMRADHVDYVAVALADADRHDNQLYIYTCNYSVPITSQSDAGKISRRIENFISHNRVFNTARWAIHISWLKCCLSVCLCLDVNQGGTDRNRCTHRDFKYCVHRPSNKPWLHIKN